MTQVPLEKIGTREHPLRASTLPHLACIMKFILMMTRDEDGGPGMAAQTGTLLHEAVDKWLKGSSLAAAREHMDQVNAGFLSRGEAEGKTSDASRWLTQYVEDPRNARLGETPADPSIGVVTHSEERVAIEIPHAEFDPTGESVWVAGTLDQLREDVHGEFSLWDLKTTRFETVGGREGTAHAMWLAYAAQLAAYAAGASKLLGKDVAIGGIIAARAWGAKRSDRQEPFIHAHIPHQHVNLILETVAEQVALIRMGHISPQVGVNCTRCWVASGPGECLPRLARLIS